MTEHELRRETKVDNESAKIQRKEWLKRRVLAILTTDPEITQRAICERLAARPEPLKRIAAELGLKFPGREPGLKLRAGRRR